MMAKKGTEFIHSTAKGLHVTELMNWELSHRGAADDNFCESSKDKQEEALRPWYMSRKEIMENSPSKKDGIDWKKETYLRKSYCTFLQDLGMRLRVPQVTIATAIIFCHKFFLQQSHARNDRWTIATVCMFLAGKVEDTPRPLRDVILISYEIIHKKDPAALRRIKQKEVYEQQKELILLGERVVLATLGFTFNVQHPYKPLVEAIKKFKVSKNALAQVAWNFVNDGLRTPLCLQFKPHHIAAGAIFLAAKFLKVKLPSDGEKAWWQEFDVTPHQLEEVSNQMLELYEQNRVPPCQGSDVDGSASAGGITRAAAKGLAMEEERSLKQTSSHSTPEHTSAGYSEVPLRGTENRSNDESAEMGSDITDHKVDLELRESQKSEHLPKKDDKGEVINISNSGTERISAGDQDRRNVIKEDAEVGWRNDSASHKSSSCNAQNLVLRDSGTERISAGDQDSMNVIKEAAEVGRRYDSASHKSSCNAGRNPVLRECLLDHSSKEAIKMIDKDKVKAAMEKRRKERGEMTLKKDVMDEDDLIERELENGVEFAVHGEKNKEIRQSWSKPDDANDKDHEENRNSRLKHNGMKDQLQKDMDTEIVVKRDMMDDASSLFNNRKRKSGRSPARQPEMKRQRDSGHYNDRRRKWESWN
ncbi:cyclin-T1-3-like [Gastrolobium bilobum]|uniref:cyclin-T1-3-like n=1 Tax=Gastrolobium bilobum TaxID=150636 RepID=UPI002AAF21F3|nr:cyclin-T1-3-like [Gastrolobium bilobum]